MSTARLNEPRTWTIKGNVKIGMGPDQGQPFSTCDGPVPDIGENVEVIEYRAYARLRDLLERCRDRLDDSDPSDELYVLVNEELRE